MRLFGAFPVFVVMIAVASTARTEYILYDGFPTGGAPAYNGTAGDGQSASDLQNQNAAAPSMIGVSSSAPWSSGTATINVDTRSLIHPFLETEQGMVRFDHSDFTNNVNGIRSLNRPIQRSDDNFGTYYISGLMLANSNFSTSPASFVFTQLATPGIALAGVGDPNDSAHNMSNSAGVRWGFKGDGAELDAYVEYRDAGGSLAQAIIADGVTTGEADTLANLFIIKLTEGGGSGDDTIEVWYNPANIANEAAAGSPIFVDTTTDVLDDASASDRITNLMVSYKQITVAASAYTDEIRMADTWAYGVAGVPEPSTLALVASGLVGLLLLRRRMWR